MNHEDVKEGMRVNFQPLKYDKRTATTGAIVKARVWQMGTRPSVWATLVSGVIGWVSCDALSLYEGDKNEKAKEIVCCVCEKDTTHVYVAGRFWKCQVCNKSRIWWGDENERREERKRREIRGGS